MATVQSLAKDQRVQQATLMALIVRELRQLWAMAFGDMPPKAADTASFSAVVAPLVQQYGAASGAVAAQFYAEQRALAGAAGAFRPTVVEPAPFEQVANMVAWALRDNRSASTTLDTPPIDLDALPGAAFTDLAGGAQRLAAQPGRRTMERAVEDDPQAVAWMRVTQPGACGFCRMLQGRGWVYLSASTAKYAQATGDPYHSHCACTTAPKFRDDRQQLPAEALADRDLWYETGAYFTGRNAINAYSRAVHASDRGHDVRAAVFDGYENEITHDARTVAEFRRLAERNGRNGLPHGADSAGDPRFRH